MRTRPLGRTGIRVSPYCLGTMMFGPFGNIDEVVAPGVDLGPLDVAYVPPALVRPELRRRRGADRAAAARR